MKRIKNFFKNNVKVLVAFIVGILVSGVSVYAATVIGAAEVSYTNNSQTNVSGALDTLYTRSNTWIDPSNMGTPQYYAFGRYKGWCSSTDTNCNSYSEFPTTSTSAPSGKNVYAVKYEDGQYGVCIQRNGKEHCFRGRNYKAEAKHVQEVFSDISCSVGSSDIGCIASDFICFFDSYGGMGCRDNSDYSNCNVDATGYVYCVN